MWPYQITSFEELAYVNNKNKNKINKKKPVQYIITYIGEKRCWPTQNRSGCRITCVPPSSRCRCVSQTSRRWFNIITLHLQCFKGIGNVNIILLTWKKNKRKSALNRRYLLRNLYCLSVLLLCSVKFKYNNITHILDYDKLW